MKIITEQEAKLIEKNWQRQRQEHIISSFEVFREKHGEYDRITSRDFGNITPEFVQALQSIGQNSPKDGLALCLGIDNDASEAEFQGKAQVFWEFTLGADKQYFAGDTDRFDTFISPNPRPLKPHMGESVNYKNEVCSNWANITYFEMNAIFFVMMQNPDVKVDGQEMFLKRPRRVLKFVIPQEDIAIMQKVCATDKNLLVHYGVNYGDAARQMVPFIPLIQVYTPVLEGISDEDDPDSTYLDFVLPCPPNCPD